VSVALRIDDDTLAGRNEHGPTGSRMSARRVAIAGAGLAGAVLARELAEKADQDVVVFEEKAEVGGHCHTRRDDDTGIMLHMHDA
jgi:monoamine oxidase